MKPQESKTPQSLRALCDFAGQQADAGHSYSHMGAAPGPMRGKRLLLAGLAMGLSILTLAVAAHFSGDGPVANVAMAMPAAARPQATPAAYAAPAMAGPAEMVRWQDSALWVDVDQMPLVETITRLAQATHTQVSGVELLKDAAPVTLHGRFGGTTIAWQALLQTRAVFNITCSVVSCRLWINSQMGPQAAAMSSASRAPSDRTPPDEAAAPPRLTPAEQQEADSQPGGSC